MKLAVLALLVAFIGLQQVDAYFYWGGYRPFYNVYTPLYRPYYTNYFTSYYPSYFGRSVRDVEEDVKLHVKPECIFYKRDGLLACQGGFMIIHCNVECVKPDVNQQINFVAIDSTFDKERNLFYLYPRSLDNTFWLNHTISLNDQFVTFSIFYAPSNETVPSYGLRVLDEQCFKDLTYLFQQSTFKYEINLVENAKFKFDTCNATILGDILITE